MQGQASQGDAAREWSDRLGGWTAGGTAGGGGFSFGGGGSADLRKRSSETLDQYGQDMDRTLGGFGEAVDQTLGGAAGDIDRTLNQAAGRVGQTLGRYGQAMGPGQINQIGASFNPWNPQLRAMIGSANQQLGRDFRQNTMPGFNRGLVGSGPGAYGGTRAGIAQGLREQGLANAMQNQTTRMAGQGYEAGLGRYVQDRQSTLANMLAQRQLGGQLGMQGAQLGGQLGMQGADLMGRLGMQGAQYGGQFGLQGAEQRSKIGMHGAELMSAQDIARIRANAQMGSASINAQAVNAATNLRAQLAAAGLAERGAGFNTAMGDSLISLGGIQQQQNQNNAGWLNGQFNHAQGMPQQRMNEYLNNLAPVSQGGQVPGLQPPNSSGQPQYDSPWAGAMQGAGSGIGMYEDVNSAMNRSGSWGNPNTPKPYNPANPAGGYGNNGWVY